MSLCLTFHVNLGLSLRKTAQALEDLYGIRISHTMVSNYCRTAALLIKPFDHQNQYIDFGLPLKLRKIIQVNTYYTVKMTESLVNAYIYIPKNKIQADMLGLCLQLESHLFRWL